MIPWSSSGSPLNRLEAVHFKPSTFRPLRNLAMDCNIRRPQKTHSGFYSLNQLSKDGLLYTDCRDTHQPAIALPCCRLPLAGPRSPCCLSVFSVVEPNVDMAPRAYDQANGLSRCSSQQYTRPSPSQLVIRDCLLLKSCRADVLGR
jgi:hypothetical protein